MIPRRKSSNSGVSSFRFSFRNEIFVLEWHFILVSYKHKTNFVPRWNRIRRPERNSSLGQRSSPMIKLLVKLQMWPLMGTITCLREPAHLCFWSRTKATHVKTSYRAANIFFSLERTYVPLRHHLGRTKQNFGRTSPKTKGWMLSIVAVKWFTIQTFCLDIFPITLVISSDMSIFWSANVRWPTVICSPALGWAGRLWMQNELLSQASSVPVWKPFRNHVNTPLETKRVLRKDSCDQFELKLESTPSFPQFLRKCPNMCLLWSFISRFPSWWGDGSSR